MQDVVKSRLRLSSGRNEKEALKIFFEMIQEVENQEVENEFSTEEEIANCDQRYPASDDE